ncbi:MAG: hypothetical protein HYS27_15815 [Deltaproteobacteria bacterium]|nr:hypothetical protein [Deltaproteobacteria bacterium]
MSAVDPGYSSVLETRTNIARLREDGLLSSIVKQGAYQTLEDAVANVEACRTLSPDRARPLLVDLRAGAGINGAARADYASPEAAPVIAAIAIVVGSPASRILANFFIGLNRLPLPTRLFTEEEAAVAWLRGYLA